jgi:hypothetical protein
MSYDPYNDPTMGWPDQSGDFPTTIKFEEVGDRVVGVMVSIERFQFGQQEPSPKYTLAEVKARQKGKQLRYDKAEMIASQINMKGQLLTEKPRPGDELDVELIGTKPSGYGSPTKLFRVEVTRADAVGQTTLSSASEEDEDFFGGQ